MECNDTEKQISHFLNEQGNYVMNANDFSQSLKHQAASQSPSRGRGRGLPSAPTSGDSTNRTRLAAEIRRLGVHSHPIGYLATTDEMLQQSPEQEITATLRSLRINCSETMLEDRGTSSGRDTTWQNTEDIRIDGKVPVILNGALFQKPRSPVQVKKSSGAVGEPLDPDTPLELQFSTIAEFHANNPFYEDESKQQVVPLTPTKKKKQGAKQPEKQPDKQQKSKKTKWKKVTVKEIAPNTEPRGRYDVAYETVSTGSIALARQPQRELYDADGKRVFPTSSGLF